MAGRSRSTFGKRQKEMKRLEKRQDKAARKDQRKQEKLAGTANGQDGPMGDQHLGDFGAPSQDPESDE